jgi:hypothetical protein
MKIINGVRFLGEVPSIEFIKGDQIAVNAGLTAGVSQFNDEPWLKFNDNGTIKLIAKKPLKYSISWNQLNEKGLVFGSVIININNEQYKVRLISGSTSNPAVNDSGLYHGFNIREREGGEWNRLMYPIFGTGHNDNNSNNDLPFGKLADYTGIELHLCRMPNVPPSGHFTLLQETSAANRYTRIGAGILGATYMDHIESDGDYPEIGWRPLLEKIPSKYF